MATIRRALLDIRKFLLTNRNALFYMGNFCQQIEVCYLALPAGTIIYWFVGLGKSVTESCKDILQEVVVVTNSFSIRVKTSENLRKNELCTGTFCTVLVPT